MSSQIVAPVSPLFARGGPSNITRLVAAAVVDAVNRYATSTIRLWSDVRDKCVEVVHPLFAHPDSTSAVMMVVPKARVTAASFSGLPRSVFRSCFPATGVTMTEVGLRGNKSQGSFDHHASTGHRAVAQIVSTNDANASAITAALPSVAAVNAWRFTRDHKSSESSTDYRRLVVPNFPHKSEFITDCAVLNKGLA